MAYMYMYRDPEKVSSAGNGNEVMRARTARTAYSTVARYLIWKGSSLVLERDKEMVVTLLDNIKARMLY